MSDKSILTENPENDQLRMIQHPSVRKMLSKFGSPDEKVLFSAKVTKINKRNKEQIRAFLITDRAVYNLKTSDFSSCKRRIRLEKIESVTVSNSSNEFVLHVPDEYDYRFESAFKDDISKHLKKIVKAKTGKALKTSYVGEDHLERITVTKAKAKLLTREQIRQMKEEMNAEVHPSDDEDKKEGHADDVETLVGNDSEKIGVDSFDLLKVLGRGSFGKVMLVRKKDTGQIYAMKILKKSMIIARQQVDHTRAERKILEALQHPFLMGLRFAFQTSTKLYLVMDYYKGGELFFHLKNKRRFSEAEAKIFVAEVAAALGHLHSLSFIYRDLKPENILMDEHGHVCLTDFGLSKDVDPDNPEATTFCGTPEYLAPEILRGGGHGKAVDWWSLGILLYELTVGIPPFYSQNVNEMYHKIQHGALRFPPFLSEDCRDLIIALLNRNPEARLGSSDKDVEEIRTHPFFSDIDWEKLLRREIEPIFKPKVKEVEGDVSNFDEQFTKEPVVDSVVPDSQLLSNDAQGQFDGFTFAPASKLS